MSTTVPQNIKGQNIMGRHKPTRNSLRHSRLIVKNFQGESSYNLTECNYINVNCSHTKILSSSFKLFYSSLAFELTEYKAFILSEICADLENCDWNKFASVVSMDSPFCKLYSSITKSLLEWNNYHHIRTTRTLFIEL